jgi:hypothetical protein
MVSSTLPFPPFLQSLSSASTPHAAGQVDGVEDPGDAAVSVELLMSRQLGSSGLMMLNLFGHADVPLWRCLLENGDGDDRATKRLRRGLKLREIELGRRISRAY